MQQEVASNDCKLYNCNHDGLDHQDKKFAWLLQMKKSEWVYRVLQQGETEGKNFYRLYMMLQIVLLNSSSLQVRSNVKTLCPDTLFLLRYRIGSR